MHGTNIWYHRREMEKKRYSLHKRDLKRGPIYYFRVLGDPKRVWRSTATSSKDEAEGYVEEYLDGRVAKRGALARFCEGFFVWGECPWIRRQHGKELITDSTNITNGPKPNDKFRK